MKKNILYILAFAVLILASCDPMKDAVNDLKPTSYTKDLVLTLTRAYANVDLANAGIVKTLDSNYSHLGDGSKASVSFNYLPPAQINPADSLLSNIAYTVTDADYSAINNNSFKNFSAAKVLQFLNTKYPTPANKQLSVLSYVYFESGVSTGVAVTETFIYLNAAWIKAYHVTQAQYISAGKLNVFNFSDADAPNLTGYFNTFLKTDAAVSAKAKTGNVQYVSFAYFSSRTNYQRIRALAFDGTNWGTKVVPAPALSFVKKKGVWIPDPTVYYTLVKADYTAIGSSDAGTPAGRANLAQYNSFDVTGGANSWTDAQINDALIVVLKAKYPNVPADETVFYKLTYALYKGAKPIEVKTFVKTGSGFEFVKNP